MPTVKSASPREMVEQVQSIEDRSDRCFENLELIQQNAWNVGAWASLTHAGAVFEKEIPRKEYGGKSHLIMLLNLSRMIPLMCRWCELHGNAQTAPVSRFRWSNARRDTAREAFEVAARYHNFCAMFPGWHRDVSSAELAGPDEVMFFSLDDDMGRRVSGYQKGFGPGNAPAPTVPRDEAVEQLVLGALETIRGGYLEIRYPRPDALLLQLNEIYQARLATAFRRYEGIPLGDFSLKEFRTVYAALTAIAGAHEHLLFRWSIGRRYPVESVVLNHTKQEWVAQLSWLANVAADVVNAIINDMTLGATRLLDLMVHPFVKLDHNGKILGVLPHFVLASNSEENILRACSEIRPRFYDATSLQKESEMTEELRALKSSFALNGPIKLGNHLPDIDFIVEDASSSTIAVCEFKWGRKPYSITEHLSRDAELIKGMNQLGMIRSFLGDRPDLLKARGVASKDLSDYRRVEYLLVARDHLKWIPPTAQTHIVGFDPFKAMLEINDLNRGLDRLLSYDWLPVENKDFKIEMRPDTVNGVTARGETFFAL